jgi:hypothetical protein
LCDHHSIVYLHVCAGSGKIRLSMAARFLILVDTGFGRMLCYLAFSAWKSMDCVYRNLPSTLVDVALKDKHVDRFRNAFWPWHPYRVTVQFLNLTLQLSASRFSPVYDVSRPLFCSFCDPTCDILHTTACAPSRSMISAKSRPKRHGWRRGNRSRLSPIRSQLA